MAEQSFGIELRAGADVSEFRRELKAAQGDVEALGKVIDKFKRQAGDVATGQRALITLEGKDAASGTIGVVTDKLNKYGKEARETIGQLNKLTGAEKRSAMGLAQKLSYLKQAQSRVEKTSRTYRTLEKGIRAYTAAIRQNNGVQKGSIADLTEQANKLQKLSELYTLGSAQQIQYANAARKIRDEIKGTTSPLSKFFGVLNRIATVQAGFTAFAAIVGTFTGSLNKFVGQQKALEGFELALKNVGLSTAEVNERLQDANRISAELGAPLEQVEKSFKRMVPALEAVGVNAEDSGRFLEGIAARTQTLGLNTEQTGRFMEAFAQVLSKGKLQSEELNQQISELDGAFRGQLAKSLGVTTQQLEDMIKNGEITSKVFVKAFNDMANGADALRERIASGNATIQQLQNLIDLIDTQNIRRIGKAIEPGIKAFLEIQVVVAEFIETVSKSQVGQLLATIFNEIAKGARDFVKAVTEVSKIIVALLEPIAGLTKLFGGLIRAVTVATLAFVSFKASLAIKGLLTSVAGGMTLVSTAATNLSTALALVQAVGIGKTLLLLKGALLKLAPLIGALLLKFAPFVAILALAKIGMDQFAKTSEKINKPAKEFKTGLEGIIAELKEIPDAAKKAAEELNKLPTGKGGTKGKPVDATTFRGGSGQEGRDEFIRITKLSNEAAQGITKVKQELIRIGVLSKEGGATAVGAFEATDNAIATSRSSLQKFITNLNETIKAEEDYAKTIDTSTNAGKKALEKSKELTSGLKEQVAGYKMVLGQVEKEITLRSESGEIVRKMAKNMGELNDQLKEEGKIRDLAEMQLETRFMKEFGDSMEEASSKAIILAAAREKLAKINLADITAQLERTRKEGPGEDGGADRDARIKKLTELQIAAQKELKESSNELNESIQADLEQTLNSISATADGYQKLATTISNSSAKIASSTIGAFGDLRRLLDAVTERELVGKSPQQRRNIEDNRLRVLAKINQIEDLIARSRLTTEFKIAQLQNQQLQEKLRAEAILAQTRGDLEGAARLQEQIGLSKQIGSEQEKVFALELQRLNIQKRLKDEMLLQQAVEKGMFSQFTNRNTQEQKIRKELGLQKTSLKDIDGLVNQITKKGTKEIFKLDKVAIKAAEQGFKKQSTAVKELQDRYKEIVKTNQELVGTGAVLIDAYSGVKNALVGVNTEASKLSGSMRDSLGFLNSMISALGSNTQARFMGGPVEGGQTYRVNDAGLGREAFMNKFGDVKMLPAASNMNWTAPSSGTIIPAKVVKAMQKNADINANISAKQTRQTPNVSSIASSAASGVSGSLAKQLGSAVSGSTSNRITNNVTIQSQSPVNDASDLMTNVARMRLRNSRRI